MSAADLTIVEVQQIVQTANDIYGEVDGITEVYVYGSSYRPMSAIWARIPNTRFVNADKSTTDMHTWVVASEKLALSVVSDYQLTFVYGPIATSKES